jgi:hypothetical protein
VRGLVQSLGVNGGTETEGDTGAEELAVRQSSDTLVVDLGLDEGVGVELVLAGNLESDTTSVSALGVPGSLSTSLDLGVHAVVVGGSENIQVVGGSDGSSVLGEAVSNGGGVLGDLSTLNVVADLSTGKEAVVADDGISIEGGALQEVEEGTGVEEGLTEVKVELSALALGSGEELGEDLGLESVGDGVVELNLGVQGVEGGPCLGEGEACRRVSVRQTPNERASAGEGSYQ